MAKKAEGTAKKEKASTATPKLVVPVDAPRCPTCGSSDREPYFGVVETEFAGLHDGLEYTHVINRRTVCKNCGQTRIDRTYENRKR